MMNSRKTTPSSAMAPRPLSSETVTPAQRRHVAGQRAEPVRPEDDAGDEEAEDRTELEALADRHQHGGRGEEDHRLAIDGEIGTFRRHRLSYCGSPSTTRCHPGQARRAERRPGT
ncbi:MAG: hypothetical protein WDN31_14730 [Hyphomicrobium sp.]